MTSPITSHVLDTARGQPAQGVPIVLEARDGHGHFRRLGQSVTDHDGRARDLLPSGHTLDPGVYRITFDTQAYFAKSQTAAFYPEVAVLFEVRDPSQHYHVPLLLNPFGYSTYRGS
jgi:5-hydroxyisourate hydrolase